jgi:probable rRNA maturation factor
VDRDNISITTKVKGKLPRLPFVRMKNAVLGKKYELSVVIVGRTTIRTINRTYRSIDKATDILSFPLDAHSGELFINLEETRKEAKKFGRPFNNFLAFLFIHGLVHLKGFDHSTAMEKEEVKFRKKFNI